MPLEEKIKIIQKLREKLPELNNATSLSPDNAKFLEESFRTLGDDNRTKLFKIYSGYGDIGYRAIVGLVERAIKKYGNN